MAQRSDPCRPVRTSVARLVTALAVLLVLTAAVFAAWSSVETSPARAAKTLADLQKLIEQAQQQKKGLDAKIAAIDERLNAIDDKLARLHDKIDVSSVRLEKQQAVYDKLHAALVLKRRELQKAELELNWQQQVFNARVVDVYKMGQISYLDVLVSSNGYNDFITRLQLVRRLVGNDNRLVGDLAKARDAVRKQKREVQHDTLLAQRVRDELQRRNDALLALRAQQVSAQQSAQADRTSKRQALSKVETSLRAWEAQEAAQAAESQGLAGVITGITGHGDGRYTGSMVMPAAGAITSPFGWRIHPIFHVRKFHTGVDIGASYGSPIHAADGGTVIYATWMSGYGNATIIDHGNGISTLYAHQSRILVTSGTVSKGQVIGYVGSTGYSTGPHLHFEVRVNGNPVDPMGYL
jgi:murein DD-endopeptidase MepM/ murein hydrolase activator NlpD